MVGSGSNANARDINAGVKRENTHLSPNSGGRQVRRAPRAVRGVSARVFVFLPGATLFTFFLRVAANARAACAAGTKVAPSVRPTCLFARLRAVPGQPAKRRCPSSSVVHGTGTQQSCVRAVCAPAVRVTSILSPSSSSPSQPSEGEIRSIEG